MMMIYSLALKYYFRLVHFIALFYVVNKVLICTKVLKARIDSVWTAAPSHS